MRNWAHFEKLTEAIETVCERDGKKRKHSVKLALGYLLKKAAKVMQGSYLASEDNG